MAKISTYPILSTPTLNDLLIGTDVENLNITKNFSIGDIASFIVGGSYVPYVGATGNVNLGAFNITSSSFIVGGGLATQFLKANGTLDSTVYQPAGNYITQLSGEATASGPGNASVTLSNSAVINKVLTGLTITGSVIVATDSILTAFGKVQNQINTLVGGVQYQGTWNAATNTPTLTSSVGVQGHYYVVSVPGSTNLNGITDWKLGDWAIYNGTAWDKIDNTDAVISVNGEVGAVVLTTTNISEGTNLYFTNSRARTAINLTTTGNSGAATYNNTNGFFNIPEYTLSGLGGVPLTRQLTINGTAFDLSANRSWNVGTVTSVGTNAPLTGGTITGSGTIGITQAGASSDGYLSSTDWTTFNSKQNVITNPVTGTGTAFFLPMWASASSLINSPLSYASDAFTFGYNSATGGTVNFTNSGLTPYTYSIQMNNFGSPRSTIHSYTDGVVVQSIGGTQVSRIFANGNTVLGIGIVDNGNKLEIEGSLKVNTIDNATTDTDRFLVSDLGVIKYRTGTELRSDIGAGVGSVTSVGLTMPSAFSVANSPVTGSGTLAVTGAGSASQYVRGDGTLADFPTTTGGGSSVSYYLNGSVSQGTIGGVAYRELSEIPIFGAGTDISIAADGYIASFITDAGDPSLLNIPAGNWNFETYFSASSGGGTPTFYVELYRYDGTTFTLIASSSGTPELISFGTNIQPYFSTLAVPQTALALTDRLAIRYYVATSGRTITLHTEDNHLCQVITTFSNGLTALNGLTEQVQYFQVGTSGTDFNIVSSVATHTFNLPDASTSNRGVVTTGTQTFAGYKIFNGTIGANVDIQLATQGTALNTFIKNINATGQTSIGSNGFGFNNANNIYFSGSSKGGGIIAFNNTGNQTYTLQNASGTLAFTSDLGGYLPLTGGTLTGALNGTSANFTGNLGSDTSVFANQAFRSLHSGSVSTINGYNSIQGDANGFIVANTTKGFRINFPSNSSFTQTLPDASGTIALTSNLSAYLPLAGGTLTGALNGTSASFSSTITAQSSGGSGLRVYGGSGTNQWDIYLNSTNLRFSDNTGTGSIVFDRPLNGTSASFTGDVSLSGAQNVRWGLDDGSANARSWGIRNGYNASGDFVILSSSTNNTTLNTVQLQIARTGAATFSGALNGTSASFTGTVITPFINVNSASGQIGSFRSTSVNGGYVTWESSTGTIADIGTVQQIFGTGGNDTFGINARGARSLIFGTNNTARFTLASTGAATFSSSVTATSGSLFNNNSGVLTQDILTIRGGGSSGAFGFRVEANNGESIFRTSNFTYNVLMCENAGNVGIGTASPSGKLHIVTPAGADFQTAINLEKAGGFGNVNLQSYYIDVPNYGLAVKVGNVTGMVVNGAGQVGIGTTTPQATLDVAGNIRVGNQLDSTSRYVGKIGTGGSIRNAIGFISSSTEDYVMINTHLSGQRSGECARFTGAGYLKASPTGTYTYGNNVYTFHSIENNVADWAAGIVNNSASNNYGLLITYPNNAPNGGDNWFIFCSDLQNARFRVASNGNVTNTNGSYGSISDIKLKENITDATPKLEDLLKVKIRNYNLIGEETKQIGVIAQELEEVFPAMIDESEDFEEVEVPQLDEEGNEMLNEEGEVVTTKQRVSKGTTTKSVKYSVFVPMLIKAIQEQQEIINEMRAEIDSLKTK
jgi:hypothetical protein